MHKFKERNAILIIDALQEYFELNERVTPISLSEIVCSTLFYISLFLACGKGYELLLTLHT